MKIYAVKDRLIGYFLTPFVAPSDKEVMAGISQEINRPDNQNAIAQAPHHFEIHSLGEIDDDGNLTARKEFICDASTLVRTRRETAEQEHFNATHPYAVRPEGTGGTGSNASANGKTLPQGS